MLSSARVLGSSLWGQGVTGGGGESSVRPSLWGAGGGKEDSSVGSPPTSPPPTPAGGPPGLPPVVPSVCGRGRSPAGRGHRGMLGGTGGSAPEPGPCSLCGRAGDF